MQTKQHPSVDVSELEAAFSLPAANVAEERAAAAGNADESKPSQAAQPGQTKHYFSVEASPVEEVMFSTLPSGATEVTIFPAKNGKHEGLGELRDAYRALNHDVLVDVHPERGAFLKITVAKNPEATLDVLMQRGLFPSSPQEKVQGEAVKVSKFQKFREVALKYATRSAVASHLLMTLNAWVTRDPDKAAAGVTFFTTNSLAAIRGTGKRGGEVDNTVAKGYKELGLAKVGIKPVDTLHYKQQQENFSGLRKGVNKIADFAWNKHPYEIGEAAATLMNAQMTFKIDEGKVKFKNADTNKWWLLNTATSFLAGITLGFVPPKKHVAEGKENLNPNAAQKGWSFIQNHSTKIGGFVNIMSNVFAVMSGVKAMQNYKTFKEKGEDALITVDKKTNKTIDSRLPENEGRVGMLPKVPFLNKGQRYLVAGVSAITFTSIWLVVGFMTFLGSKNKLPDYSDNEKTNDIAAKSAELVLQAEESQQPDIALKLAKYFGEMKEVKGKPEELYALITQKANALRGSSFVGANFAAVPDIATVENQPQEISKQPSVAERVASSKREGQWAEKSTIAPDSRRENATQPSLA